MEPRASTPERAPQQPPSSQEYQLPVPAPGESALASPERAPELPKEQSAELHQATTQATAAGPVTLPTPVVPVTSGDDTSQVATDDTPLVAGDDDLIEKEWVDKAKKIISQTRDDPHAREREVGRLQADYLRKRYGKELGATD